MKDKTQQDLFLCISKNMDETHYFLFKCKYSNLKNLFCVLFQLGFTEFFNLHEIFAIINKVKDVFKKDKGVPLTITISFRKTQNLL